MDFGRLVSSPRIWVKEVNRKHWTISYCFLLLLMLKVHIPVYNYSSLVLPQESETNRGSLEFISK